MANSGLTTFICLFHGKDRAESAVNALESAGFSRNSITSVWGNQNAETASLDDELATLGVPSRDLKHLKDGVVAGGVVVRLEAAEDRSDEIEGIFHKFSANKIDEQDVNLGGAAPFAPTPVVAAPVQTDARADERVMAAEGAVVAVVAEDLVVGKREVERGGVRVFRRTVEEPVSESVNLHEEHVVVDRRPVDRAVTDADFTAASRTIELTETEEVPVVSKVARVVEEVRVGVEETDRTETVRDTVRHTEVDVEPVETSTSTTGTVTGTKGTGTGQGY